MALQKSHAAGLHTRIMDFPQQSLKPESHFAVQEELERLALLQCPFTLYEICYEQRVLQSQASR